MKDRIARLRQEIARLRELAKDYDPEAAAELHALVEEMRAFVEDMQKRMGAGELGMEPKSRNSRRPAPPERWSFRWPA